MILCRLFASLICTSVCPSRQHFTSCARVSSPSLHICARFGWHFTLSACCSAGTPHKHELLGVRQRRENDSNSTPRQWTTNQSESNISLEQRATSKKEQDQETHVQAGKTSMTYPWCQESASRAVSGSPLPRTRDPPTGRGSIGVSPSAASDPSSLND